MERGAYVANYTILSKGSGWVKFEKHAQNHKDGQFSIPMEICHELGLKSGDYADLEVKSKEGTKFFERKQLRSGPEIYGPEIREHVKAGEHLVVTVRLLMPKPDK